SEDAEAKRQAEIADAAAPQREASRDRRRQDHEQRGRLRGVLREAHGQGEEGNDDRPASDPEQPRGGARDDAESDERDIERDSGHPRTPISTATPTRKAPKTTLRSRSSICTRNRVPIWAPTIDPAASPIASHQRT